MVFPQVVWVQLVTPGGEYRAPGSKLYDACEELLVHNTSLPIHNLLCPCSISQAQSHRLC